MNVFASLLTTLALHGPATPAARPAVAPPDSIGVEMRGGQRFVRHRVAAGETLYGLARQYRVTVDQLTEANPQVASGLGVGQIVYVPRRGGSPAPAAAKAPAPAKAPAAKTATTRYTVTKGETLYGIARRFQTTPDELIRLNHLAANGSVQVGQELMVRAIEAAAASVTSPAAPAGDVPTNPPLPDPAQPAQVATVTPAVTPAQKEEVKAEEAAPTRASEVVSRVTESGMGAQIDKSVTDKYLALHKTAPVGTIMQVKNQMNGQSVYVRVIGKLPETGENNNVLVRLSPRAVQKLGTSDGRFRVETSYIP